MKEKHRVLLEEGQRLIDAGRSAPARTFIHAVIDEDRSIPQAWLLAAMASHDITEKCKALHRALQLDPSYSDARRLLEELDCASLEIDLPPQDAGAVSHANILLMVVGSVIFLAAIGAIIFVLISS